MPCRYDPSPEEEAAARARIREERNAKESPEILRLRAEVSLYSKQANLVTRLLCSVMPMVEGHLTIVDHAELMDWWKEHRIRDNKRLLAEKLEQHTELASRINKIRELGGEPTEVLVKLEFELRSLILSLRDRIGEGNSPSVK